MDSNPVFCIYVNPKAVCVKDSCWKYYPGYLTKLLMKTAANLFCMTNNLPWIRFFMDPTRYIGCMTISFGSGSGINQTGV
jgi:hypothetical protein